MTVRALRSVACLALVLASALSARAQSLPDLTASVTDRAGVIDADTTRELEARILALQRATGDVVVVATVPTFAPYGSIEEYAVKLFAHAGVGQQHKDNGLLIVVAVQERRVRIEVGYGLESIVTDGYSGETIREAMLPEFRAGRYGVGIRAGANRIINHIAAARRVSLIENSPGSDSSAGGSMMLGFVLFIVLCAVVLGGILLVVALIARATGGARKTPLSGGALGSGSSASAGSRRSDDDDSKSSSFGGGSSGGGGASGSW